jgi:hypothetical protein
MRNFTKGFLGLCAISLVACEPTPEKEKTIDQEELSQVALGFGVSDYVVNTFYNVPSPSEQLHAISTLDGFHKVGMVNDLKKVDDYVTNAKRCLNFGCYSADATYLAAYEQNQVAFQYLSTLNNLGDKIGLNAVLSNELADVIDGEAYPDSLFKLADELYLRSFDRLIENEKGEDLALILVGAWFETMHLVINSSKGFKHSPLLNQFLAEQKLVAENLLSFLTDFQDGPLVKNYIDFLSSTLEIYEGMICTHSETKVTHLVKSEANVITVKGGTKCQLNELVFLKLKDFIGSVRTEIVS